MKPYHRVIETGIIKPHRYFGVIRAYVNTTKKKVV